MGRVALAAVLFAAAFAQPVTAGTPGRTLAFATAGTVVAGGRTVHARHRPRALTESTSGRYLAWEETGTTTFLRVWDRETGAVEDAELTEEPTGIDAGPRDSFVIGTHVGLTSAVPTPSGVRLTRLLTARGVGSVISDGTRLLVAKPVSGASNLGGPCAIYEVRAGRLALLVPPHLRQNLCVKFVSFHAGRLLYTEGVGINHCAGFLHFERISLSAPRRGTALQLPPPPNGAFWMVPSVRSAGGAIVASLIPLRSGGCFTPKAPTTFMPELWRYTSTGGWAQVGHLPAWDVVVEPSGRIAAITGLVHAPHGLGIPQLTGAGSLQEQTPNGWRVVARGVYELAD